MYIDDDTTRTDEYSSILMYRVYDGNQWSNATPVLNDGTGDFEPVVCPDNNGGAHIIWQNATNTFSSGATLSEMSSAIDLNYIHFNGAVFDSFQVLTSSNSTPEMNHRIAASDNKIAVVWMENSEDDIFGLTGSNSIYQKVFSSGSWNSTELIASNLSVVNSLDISFDNNLPVVAYTAKSGNNSSVINDFELYCHSNGQTTNLTNDNVADIFAVYCGNNLYWNSNGSIKTIRENNGISEIVTLTQTSIGIGKFELFEKSDGLITAVWESENQEGMTIYRSDLNEYTEVFEQPYEIEKDFGVVRGWDACLNPDDSLQLIYCYADYLTNTDDLDYGTLNLVCKTESSICNIAVDPIATYEGTIAQNEEITVKTDVYNIGSETVNQFSISIKDQNNTVISSQTVNQTLNPGEGIELNTPFTLPNFLDNEYCIEVLPSSAVDYTDTDNKAVLSVGYCDILIESIEEIRNNNTRQLKVSITNNGPGEVDSATLSFYKESINNSVSSSQSISNLDDGDTAELTFTLDNNDLDSLISEEARIYCFNIESDYIETDYSNNFLSTSVYPDYQLNLSSGNGGRVSGAGFYEANSSVMIKAEPSPGYLFDGWYENDELLVGVPKETEIRINRNRSIVARFKQTDLSIVGITLSNTPKKGFPLTVKAEAEGGALPYKWNYVLYLNGSAIDSKYNVNNYFSFKIKSAGDYKVVITCIDDSGTRRTETRYFTVDESYKINIGETLPVNSENVREWVIDNPRVVTVNDDGQAVGSKLGETKVKVITKDGHEVSYDVKVKLSFWQIILLLCGVGLFFLPFWV